MCSRENWIRVLHFFFFFFLIFCFFLPALSWWLSISFWGNFFASAFFKKPRRNFWQIFILRWNFLNLLSLIHFEAFEYEIEEENYFLIEKLWEEKSLNFERVEQKFLLLLFYLMEKKWEKWMVKNCNMTLSNASKCFPCADFVPPENVSRSPSSVIFDVGKEKRRRRKKTRWKWGTSLHHLAVFCSCEHFFSLSLTHSSDLNERGKISITIRAILKIHVR